VCVCVCVCVCVWLIFYSLFKTLIFYISVFYKGHVPVNDGWCTSRGIYTSLRNHVPDKITVMSK